MHWRRKWQPTPVFLPGESQGQGSLVGCHLWGRTESNTTEVISSSSSWWLSSKESACNARDEGLIPVSGRSPGGGYGDPLQYSCLKNCTDRGAWWSMIYRVAKSWTQLKQLSMHSGIDRNSLLAQIRKHNNCVKN